MVGSKFNAYIAILVSITAVFIAVFNIKDGNIVQAMSQAQARAIDAWAFYQAKSTKQHIAENTQDQLQIQLVIGNLSDSSRNLIQSKIVSQSALIHKYDKEKTEIKAQAEGFQKEYDALNFRDDQFDMADAFLSIAIAIFGVAALTQQTKLLYFALGLSCFGILFGICGFANLSFHPDWLAAFLS